MVRKLCNYDPYDTPTFRYTQSLYHKHHKDVDKEIGKFIKKLEDENLLDNTIIFYYEKSSGSCFTICT